MSSKQLSQLKIGPTKMWAMVFLSFCSFSALASNAGTQAAAQLEFEAIPDGRCQILSEGGKLFVLRNNDETRPIKYRLIRYFADVKQGRLVGIAAPGGATSKLGCTRVGGREQRWEIERASFIQE